MSEIKIRACDFCGARETDVPAGLVTLRIGIDAAHMFPEFSTVDICPDCDDKPICALVALVSRRQAV